MTRSISFIILSFLFLFSCSKDESANPGGTPPGASINKIMPLGASRVAGARPEYESYRYDLWKLMIDGGYTFDFVGTETDPASYPDHAGLSFDTNHEGRGGINSSEIRASIDQWLSDGTIPDIVLFSSPGGNDDITMVSYEDIRANINAIIDAIQSVNPNVTIIIEQAAPPRSDQFTPIFQEFYNRAIQDIPVIAQEQTTSTSTVLAVNMNDGFNDTFLVDDVHYNTAGASFIAQRYYDILQTVLK